MIVPSFSILSGAHPGAESKAEGFSLWNELRDVSPANAPEGDILDITEPFFRIDKTYYIQSFINLMLFGSDGDIDKAVKNHVHLNTLFHTGITDMANADGKDDTLTFGDNEVSYHMKAVFNDDQKIIGLFVFCV